MVERKFEADPLQDEAIRQIANSTSGALLNGSGTGAGKTRVAVCGALARGARRVLVAAQPKVFENFQETLRIESGLELRPCANQKFQDFSKAEMVANKEACMNGEDGWFFVSRELFQRESWHTRTIQHRNGRTSRKTEFVHTWDLIQGFDFLIYDEVQMAAAAKSKSQKSLKNIKTAFLLAQSADWFGAQYENMYHVAKTLWPAWVESDVGDFNQWIDDWMVTEYDHFAYNKKKIVGEQWPGAFAATFPDYVYIPSPVEKPEPERHYIDLSVAQRKLYEELNKKLAAEIEGDLLVVELNMHLKARLRELTLGVFHPVDEIVMDGDAGERVVKQTIDYRPGDPSTTIDEIREIMADHPGEPVIVLTHSRKFAEKAAIDLGGLPYTGKQNDTQRQLAREQFLAREVDVLVGTEAMCEGLDGLQKVCRTAIIASRPNKNYMTGQFIGRIARRGQEREPLVYEIVRRNTIDVGVVDAAIEKAIALNAARAVELKKSEENA